MAIETLKVQMEERTAALGEARAELTEVRAALETETVMRTAAQTRVRKLEAKIATIRVAIDEEDDAVPEVVSPEAPTEADPEVATAAPAPAPADTLGLSPVEIGMVDALVAHGEAPDRSAMLRLLVLRALTAEGVTSGMTLAGADREEEQATPS